jgi:hypothetical protein
MSAREILRRITATAHDVAPEGHDNRTGYGIVRPFEALTAEISSNAHSPVFEEWQRSRRQRALHPIPIHSAEETPNFVSFRTRVTEIALAVGGTVLLVLLGVGGIVLVIIRRRTRDRLSGPQGKAWINRDKPAGR